MAHMLSRLAFLACCATAAAAQAGTPLPAEPWTKREYIDLYFSHYNGTLALPHLRKPESKAVFERMVDPANVRAITAGPASADEKRRHIGMMLATMGEIRAAYAYAVLVGEPLDEELARVRAFTLLVLDASVRLSEGERSSRRRDAWRTTFFGVVDALAESNPISAAQLCAALAEHYPAIRIILAEVDRRAFRERVRRLLAQEKTPSLRAAYARLLTVSEAYEAP